MAPAPLPPFSVLVLEHKKLICVATPGARLPSQNRATALPAPIHLPSIGTSFTSTRKVLATQVGARRGSCLLRLGGGWAVKAPSASTATLCKHLGGTATDWLHPQQQNTHTISPRDCCWCFWVSICKAPATLENMKIKVSAPNYRNGVGNRKTRDL